MNGPELVVDGYNVLLALAEREGMRHVESQLPRLRSVLQDLLSQWAVARERPVTLAWDGEGAAPAEPLPGLRVVYVHRPAEADDWIVEYVSQLRGTGRDVVVATADRGLLGRLPDGVERADMTGLMQDLHALGGGTLRTGRAAAAAAMGDEVPATDDPVDLARLPRRHAGRRRVTDDPRPVPGASPAPPRAPARPRAGTPRPSAASGAAGATDAESGDGARDRVRDKRDAGRAKYERARRRRDASAAGRAARKGRGARKGGKKRR